MNCLGKKKNSDKGMTPLEAVKASRKQEEEPRIAGEATKFVMSVSLRHNKTIDSPKRITNIPRLTDGNISTLVLNQGKGGEGDLVLDHAEVLEVIAHVKIFKDLYGDQIRIQAVS